MGNKFLKGGLNKKYNSGFTLIEVLSIITILGIITVLVFPNISGSNEVKKEKEFEKIKIIVENAGKFYHSFNSDEYKVSVDKLKEENYITSDLINPETGEDVDGCVRIVKDSDGFLIYKYTSCDAVEVPFKVELNGGVTSQKFETTYYDSTTIELIEPTKENSDFKGWEVVKGNSILDGNKLTIGDTETILWAKWESWPLLTVNLNGGNSQQVFKEAYRSGSNIFLKPPEREGHTFTGWKVTSGNGLLSGNTFTMGSVDTTIEANYAINTYEISYNLNGGTLENKPSSGEYHEIVTINNPSRIGYTFAGWTVTGTGSTMTNSNLTIGYSNVELSAKWNANTYTINYYIGNGTSTGGVTKLGSSTCKYDSSCDLTSFTNLNGIFPYSSQDNTTNGKTNYSWVFYGWSETETGLERKYENSDSFTYQIADDINLYAVGRKTIYINSGIAPTTRLATLYQYWNPYSTDLLYLSSVKLPNPTAIEGWTFVGYRGGSNAANSSVTFAASLAGTNTTPAYSVYPQTRSVYKRTVSIEYNANGGSGTVANSSKTQYYNSGYSSSNKNNGATISTPTFTLADNKFTKTGYTFNKWEDESSVTYEAGASYTGFTPEVSSTDTVTTMKATWKANTYTIKYDGNGSTSGATLSSTHTYDTAKTLTANGYVKTDYTFVGWNTKADGSGTTYLNNASVKNLTSENNGTVTLYAQWQSTTMVIGQTFRDLIPKTTTKVIFTDEKAPSGTTLTDVSAVGDKGVVMWSEGTTLKISTQRSGVQIVANSNCEKMFGGSSSESWYSTRPSITSIDMTNLNINKVTNMKYFFAHMPLTTLIFPENFNTSKVTNMYGLFRGISMTNIDYIITHEGFITNNVTNMRYMFAYSKMTSLNLSKLNTVNVTDMRSVFEGSAVTSLDLSTFNTSKVTSMSYMFGLADQLVTVDLSSFDTQKVTDMSYVFANARKLKTVYVSDKWSTGKVTNSVDMFKNASSIVGGNGTVYSSSYTDKAYARVDKAGTPGYFTYKASS